MLQLKNIKKSYTVAGFTQNALDGISVAFRDNEFAAVLGPSGSGKTTMLNVIGGLDRYDSGELEIDGISTKHYKDKDWDTYRNNRIGFVFQSYNLIPHQSVLANVELALTLSGVSKGERRRRAKDALEQVGLGEHIRKKPNQLSGGQMQRVAIARALINDPEILLADEPTGALDSKTSLQVMELLVKIAEDRCVIMVTHNNELAGRYANRIVHLTDGKVTSDSRPFDPLTEKQREATAACRSRMSFFTAISLSLANLMTKKGRTFTTAFAGSIGIIGIATIMSFSNGINAYIKGIEEDTLSLYPLTIQQQSFDLSALFSSGDDSGERPRGWRERPEGTVREVKIMESVFASQRLNDLASLKTHIDGNMDSLGPYVTAIDYTYDVTPQIYLADTSKGIDRIHPDSMFTSAMGGSGELPTVAGMGPGMMMNVFHELPNEPALYRTQYEVITGRWPESYDEAVLVLQWGYRILDFTLYSLGVRDRDEMRAMLESVMSGSSIGLELSESEGFYTYERLMESRFKVVCQADMFHYDETFGIWVDKSGDTVFMEDLLDKSTDLRIVGIVQPLEDASTTVLSAGINYTGGLIFHLIEKAMNSQIVKEQTANPEVNVISGNTFRHERENPPVSFDFSKIMSVDEEAISEAMGLGSLENMFDFGGMDTSALDLSGLDLSSLDLGSLNFSAADINALTSALDLSALDFSSLDLSDFDPGSLGIGEFRFDMEQFDFGELPLPEMDFQSLTQAIASLVNIPPEAITGIMQTIAAGLISDTLMPAGLLTPPLDLAAIGEAAGEYLASPEIPALIEETFSEYTDLTVLQEQLTAALTEFTVLLTEELVLQLADMLSLQVQSMMESIIEQALDYIQDEVLGSVQQFVRDTITDAVTSITGQLTRQLTRQMTQMMSGFIDEISEQVREAVMALFEDMAGQMRASFDGVDSDAMAEAFQIEMSEEAVFELMSSMMNPVRTSYEGNLASFGYADISNPTQILLYPVSFEAKEEVMAFLDRYNSEMERAGQRDKIVLFTDFVGMMMSSVTDIVDIVSYALVAFVSVALVVSSIMIGVITFVSVLERKKEIGILRAVGASKGNIRLVFNAETLIIGFAAGIIGVVATSFIIIIANIILDRLVGINNLVIMAPEVPLILVSISMFLTFLAGLVPAQAAASKPPVEALRSE